MCLKMPPSMLRYSVSTGKIAILMQHARRDRDLVTRKAPAVHGATEDPVRTAVAVIGSVRAVLAECAAELTLLPQRQHRVCERRMQAPRDGIGGPGRRNRSVGIRRIRLRQRDGRPQTR